jgi:hypothetical protein
VIDKSDLDYDTARLVWNGGIDCRPVAITRCVGPSDVAATIAGFGSAREHRRLIAPIRKAPPPLFELVTPLPYVELHKMLDGTAPWGIHAYHMGPYLQEFTDVPHSDLLAGRGVRRHR